MSAKLGVTMMPIVSKVYCSASEVVLAVRRRPNVANGGGFVVADYCQRVVFSVDGCGVLGRKEELILRDGEGNALLLIRRKGSIIEALSITRQWKGFTYDFIGSHKLVFTLKSPTTHAFRGTFQSGSPLSRRSAALTETLMSMATSRTFLQHCQLQGRYSSTAYIHVWRDDQNP
ncbi:UNVERIFIED_CONTAM: protein LURP-one-related 6 [Sesamum angustifolium]|uniref:Protein LURP-one-related 6 n=1 Tax=Sesamum angustifolium TaxID=2727405 RepID=A0AAW2N8Y6_9LAMI